jgi:uncharacterized protein YqgQ
MEELNPKFDIQEFMKMFHVELKPEDKREFMFYTGQRGAEMFEHTFEVMMHESSLKDLFSKNIINQSEFLKLNQMLTSSDWENTTMVSLIINSLNSKLL